MTEFSLCSGNRAPRNQTQGSELWGQGGEIILLHPTGGSSHLPEEEKPSFPVSVPVQTDWSPFVRRRRSAPAPPFRRFQAGSLSKRAKPAGSPNGLDPWTELFGPGGGESNAGGRSQSCSRCRLEGGIRSDGWSGGAGTPGSQSSQGVRRMDCRCYGEGLGGFGLTSTPGCLPLPR